jgi:hypothetical protein
MTRLALSEDAGEKFDARGLNTATNKDDEQIVFYRDITKVQVISESDNFAIQVVTKDVVVGWSLRTLTVSAALFGSSRQRG